MWLNEQYIVGNVAISLLYNKEKLIGFIPTSKLKLLLDIVNRDRPDISRQVDSAVSLSQDGRYAAIYDGKGSLFFVDTIDKGLYAQVSMKKHFPEPSESGTEFVYFRFSLSSDGSNLVAHIDYGAKYFNFILYNIRNADEKLIQLSQENSDKRIMPHDIVAPFPFLSPKNEQLVWIEKFGDIIIKNINKGCISVINNENHFYGSISAAAVSSDFTLIAYCEFEGQEYVEQNTLYLIDIMTKEVKEYDLWPQIECEIDVLTFVDNEKLVLADEDKSVFVIDIGNDGKIILEKISPIKING